MDGNIQFINPTNTIIVTKMNASMENVRGRSPENNAQFEVLAQSDCLDNIAKPSGQAEEVNVDWFEPLEEDNDEPDAPSWDAEESPAGESEKSCSEGTFKRTPSIYHRLKRDEGWEDWPALGDGWKRRTVIRRSGSSMGMMDVYYMSPLNKRVRSRVELGKVLNIDLSTFDYKLGIFSNGQPVRKRRKRVRKDRSPSSESGSSISNHRLTPGPTSRVSLSPGSGTGSALGTPDEDSMFYQAPLSPDSGESIKSNAKMHWSHTSRQTSSLNGLEASKICFRICAKCGNPYSVSESERQGKKTCCLKCKVKKPVDNCNIVFRRSSSDRQDLSVKIDCEEDDEDYDEEDDEDEWVKKRHRRACGLCKACLSTRDCGTCDFCIDKPKFGGSNKKKQKCRLRQCQRQAKRHLLPFQLGWSQFEAIEGTGKMGKPTHDHTRSRKKKKRKSATYHPEMTTLDGKKKKGSSLDTAHGFKHKRRKTIHGTNHQPPLQAQERYANTPIPGQSSWRGEIQKMDTGVVMQSKGPEDEEEEITPMITQIFSLAQNASLCGSNMDVELLKLLEATRKASLPFLWYAIMTEGPQLQLVQCSKMSTMTDTVVQINPGFSYQVAVQGQPLLLTHPLYENHPAAMSSTTLVLNLLLDLERYRVCQGVPDPEPASNTKPFICERASTCDFLILKNEECCKKCSALTL